jgi:hypothetical protein
MIAMRVPFDEKPEVLAFMKAKVESDAPDIRQLRPDVDEKIASRLILALAREPAQRPASTRAVLAGIEDSLRRL